MSEGVYMTDKEVRRREYVCDVVRELKWKIKKVQRNYNEVIRDDEVGVDVDKEFEKRIRNKNKNKLSDCLKRNELQLNKEELHIKKWKNKRDKDVGMNWINESNKINLVVKYNDNKYIKPGYRKKMFVSGY